MKKVLLVLSVCGALFANEVPEKLNDFKQGIIEITNQEIAVLESHKKCVYSASNKEEMKACRQVKKSNMKILKDQAKALKAKFKQNIKNEKTK